MIPKKYREFKKNIAKELGVHENLVDDFIAFYYRKVRTSLSCLDYPKVFVEGLGTFTVRKKKAEKKISKYKDILGNVQKQTYKGFAKSVEIKKTIYELENVVNIYNELLEERKKFREDGME
jgi:nucleoid DNA-binding protein